MIIDKSIYIQIKNKKQLNSILKMGYKKQLNINDLIDLPIKYLSYNSHLLVTVKCDNCNSVKKIKYQSYNKSTNNNKEKYFCINKDCINKKRKSSLNKKYNVDNVFELKKIKEKIKNTNLDKYGVENPQQNKKIKEKTELTNLKKYGFKNVFQNDIIKEKIKKTNLKKYGVEYPQQSEYIRSKYSSIHKSSKVEKELYNLIKKNYNNRIICNSKKIIQGYELDIYLPELNLAFEFNGLYWHNELHKSIYYHYNKTDLCSKKGIQLIHIWEDDWEYKHNIVKSIILNNLNIYKYNINSNKCNLKLIKDNNLIKDFLNKNHIQGYIKSDINIGLFFNDNLVSLITLNKSRKYYNILRFCDIIHHNIIRSFDKLLKYFIKNYNPRLIKIEINRSYSNEIIYKLLGFKLKGITEPNCLYINNRKREHKFLHENNYKIYDSGNYDLRYENYLINI